MNVKKKFKNLVLQYLKQRGYGLITTSELYEWQNPNYKKKRTNHSSLPSNAKDYLKPDNKRLLELKKAYMDSSNHSHLLWTDEHVTEKDLLFFRGDNAYVWQLRGTNMNILGYALTTYYLKSIDRFNLLENLFEDDYFGNYTFNIDGKIISRDILDSINEIYFLENHLNISTKVDLNILDIGAGYGRLAHRMVKSFPNISNYYCTDGIAISSFIAEYYLSFRELGNASMLPLNNVNSVLSNQKIDIALNIHSFSECSIESVDWWISLLKHYQVKYLMIIPNVYVNSSELLVSHDRQSISKVIEKYGYRLVIEEPKFKDPIVQKYGINPTSYFLYELKSI